jgi:hypothetical protein
MTIRPGEAPLIDSSTALFRRQRPWFALAAALLLVALGLIVLAAQRGDINLGYRGELWRLGLQPAVIIYVLVVYPWLQGRSILALDSLRSLGVPASHIAAAGVVSDWGERLALLVGALFSVVISHSIPVGDAWLMAYDYSANALMFAMMALAIYDGGARTRNLARLVNADLKLDLFDRQSLVPLARWGQTVTLTFVGGTCLSLLFQSHRTLNTVASAVIYSIMVVVALSLFFTSTWSIHAALRAARDRELADVRRRLDLTRGELKRVLALDVGADATCAYQPVVVLGLYEKQVLEASTWPFNPKIVKELLASVAVPVLIYCARLAFGLPGVT